MLSHYNKSSLILQYFLSKNYYKKSQKLKNTYYNNQKSQKFKKNQTIFTTYEN